MKCFYCGEEISSERHEMKFVPLDRPYVNLPVHNGCVQPMEEYGLNKYLEDNIERIYLLAGKTDHKESNRKGKFK